MSNINMDNYERDSVEAWSYHHIDEIEMWTVVAHKVGTAGSLDSYAIAYEYYNTKTNEWSLIPDTNLVFTGVNAREEIYEYVGL